MRYLFVGMALLGLLILICCWSGRVISDRTKAVILPLEKAIQAGGPSQAGTRKAWAEAADSVWREGLPLLSCLVSHSYTAEISDGLTELPTLTGAEFERSCLRIRQGVIRLQEMDMPWLGNIF